MLFIPVVILPLGGHLHQLGAEAQGTHPAAAAAAQAGGHLLLRHFHIVKAQGGQRIVVLADRGIQGGHTKSHHGAAGKDLLGCQLEAAGSLHQFPVAGADLDNKVAGLFHGVAGYGKAALHQRLIEVYGPVDGVDGGHIVHHAAGIRRQHTQLQVLLGDDADQGTLAALGVLGLYRHDADAPAALHGLLHGGNGLGLVVLNNHNALRVGEQPQNQLHTGHDLPGPGLHQLIVTGNIGLTLGTVGNDKADLFRFLHRQLYMGGESGAAHAHDTGIAHLGKQLLIGQSFHIRQLLSHALRQRIGTVIFHHNGHRAAAGGILPNLHRLDCAGHGTMNVGGHEPSCLSDHLTGQNLVTLLNHRRGRLANVLIGHIDQFALREQGLQSAFLGKLLVACGMNTAMECLSFHVHLSLFTENFHGNAQRA